MKKEIESNTLDVIKECIEEKETTNNSIAHSAVLLNTPIM